MSVPIHLADNSLFAYDQHATEKCIGLIVLATDHSVEPDFSRLVASDRVGIFSTRIQYANPTTPERLRKMAPRLTEAAALILPDEDLDVICFMCTSASVVIGNEAIRAAIQQVKPGVPVVTPTTASVAALRKLGARRISVLTPYTIETSEPMAAYFAAQGFSIANFTCLGLEDDRRMAELSRDTLLEAAVAATSPEADALFISCTALRSASVVAAIEARITRPVVSSNQAAAWACLAQCGLPGPSSAVAGRLFA